MSTFEEEVAKLRVLVVGDAMLDTYYEIETGSGGLRLKGTRVYHRPGGAANVAAQCAALGSEVTLAAGMMRCDDEAGDTLMRELALRAVRFDPYLMTRTTRKVRIVDESGNVLAHIDYDAPLEWERGVTDFGRNFPGMTALRTPSHYDVLIISDSGKGAVSKPSELIRVARGRGVRTVVVDPCPIERRESAAEPGWSGYAGADLLTPNGMEFEQACDMTPETEVLHRGPVLITHGQNDAELYKSEQSGSVWLTPPVVVDPRPCGAGDVVTAVAALSLGVGLPLKDACQIAIDAASEACRHPGTYVVPEVEASIEGDAGRVRA